MDVIRGVNMKHFLITLLFMCFSSFSLLPLFENFKAFKAYQDHSYDKSIAVLQQQQIENPQDRKSVV